MSANARSGDLQNELSWSHSRYGTFCECRRRYYYHYYGAWGGWQSDADELTKRLYLLKQLKGRHLWAGAVVHDAVAAVLARARARLPLPPAGETAEAAVARMRTDFRRSRAGDYLADPRGTVGLLEHHYAQAVPDRDWQDLAEMVRRSIHGFFAEAWLPLLSQIAPQDWLALEELQDFDIDGGRVYVKMDLAFRRPEGGVTIVDWKTGRRRPQPDGLQLGTYALYAVDSWQIPAATIQVVEVNLATRDVAAASVTSKQISGARDAIRQGFAQMRAPLADVERNIARLEDFAPCARPETCARCPFREVCTECAERTANAGYRPDERAR